MATTHQRSVIANSCVKPPVNPDTGFTVTNLEKTSTHMHNTWDGYIHEFNGNSQNVDVNMKGEIGRHSENDSPVNRSNGLFTGTDSMIQNLSSDLSNLSDDVFYKRLLELKHEHKKTLSLCESLYSKKVGDQYTHNTVESGVHDHHSRNDDGPKKVTLAQPWHNTYGANMKRNTTVVRDNIKDMSKSPIRRSRPYSAKPDVAQSQGMQRGHVQTDYSSDEEYWKPLSAVTTDLELSRDEDYENLHPCHHSQELHEHNDSKYSAMSQIGDMWDNFSVDAYAPVNDRHRSTMSRMSNSSKKSNKSDLHNSVDTEDWRHRITLPKPFNMSLRESNKIREKSQTLLDYEARKASELKSDEEECQKKFKAKPVPAHVYMALFEDKLDDMGRRRKAKDLMGHLKSTEKPFNFTKREEEHKKSRSEKYEDCANSEVLQKPTAQFKARPFPAHIFDDSVMNQLQEEEEYRKIRVQMRAEELLKTSSLPPNMAARGKDYCDGKSRQKLYAKRAKVAGFTSEHKFKPKINESLPDFEEKHRQMLHELSEKRGTKEATICKPFNLRTQQIAVNRQKVYDDISKDTDNIQNKTWSCNKTKASKLSRMRSLSSSMDSIPTKMTTSAQLRTTATRNKMQQELDLQLAELEKERQQRLKEKKIKKYIAERVAVNDNSKDIERSLKTKLKQYRVSEKERKMEYLQMLNEIEERIEKRPLLFERAQQATAKQTAEKKYNETLSRAGLDSDYITSQGKSATEADMEAVSDDEAYLVSRLSSARSSARSHSSYKNNTSKYSDDYEDGSRTSEGSDIETY